VLVLALLTDTLLLTRVFFFIITDDSFDGTDLQNGTFLTSDSQGNWTNRHQDLLSKWNALYPELWGEASGLLDPLGFTGGGGQECRFKCKTADKSANILC